MSFVWDPSMVTSKVAAQRGIPADLAHVGTLSEEHRSYPPRDNLPEHGFYSTEKRLPMKERALVARRAPQA